MTHPAPTAPTRAEIDEAMLASYMKKMRLSNKDNAIAHVRTMQESGFEAAKSGTSMTAEEVGAAICAGFDSGYKKALMDSAKSGRERFTRMELIDKIYNVTGITSVSRKVIDALIEIGVLEVKP